MTGPAHPAAVARAGVATWIVLAVGVVMAIAWAASPEALAAGSGAIAHVAIVAEHRLPSMRRELVLRGRRHDGAGRVEAVPLQCTFDALGDSPARFVRAIRRDGNELRVVLDHRAPCRPGTPRRAVVAGQAVVLEFAPAHAATRR